MKAITRTTTRRALVDHYNTTRSFMAGDRQKIDTVITVTAHKQESAVISRITFMNGRGIIMKQVHLSGEQNLKKHKGTGFVFRVPRRP